MKYISLFIFLFFLYCLTIKFSPFSCSDSCIFISPSEGFKTVTQIVQRRKQNLSALLHYEKAQPKQVTIVEYNNCEPNYYKQCLLYRYQTYCYSPLFLSTEISSILLYDLYFR